MQFNKRRNVQDKTVTICKETDDVNKSKGCVRGCSVAMRTGAALYAMPTEENPNITVTTQRPLLTLAQTTACDTG